MTQVELPQLSLQRYVDLVKRRRWQLVPVSLLGLLVGGLVAFFIPRFFVAETLLEHQQVPTGADDPEDPFRAVVDTAKSTIPLAAGEVIDELKWPEVAGLDDFARGQFERAVEERITVNETNGGDRTRSYALIRVQYRDRNGDRAATFLNKLVEVWGRRRTAELRAPAEEQRIAASTNADRARSTLADYMREKQALERQYGFDPLVDIAVQRMEWPKEEAERREREASRRAQEQQRARLAAAIESDRARLTDLPSRVPPDATNVLTEALKVPAAKLLVVRWLRAKQEYENTFHPGTQAYFNSKRQAALLLEQIKALVPQPPVDEEGLVPNRAYVDLLTKIAADELKLTELDAALDLEARQLAADQKRFATRVEGYSIYTQKLSQVEEARGAKEEALADLKAATDLITRLNRELPVRTKRPAVVPPAPTEPNILVVALIGCVLGLAAAVGLILAFDVLQGSFKTIEDVERGVPVPVLGGVAHMETVEERQQATRGRRRVAVTAGLAVAMITVVVSIFYIDSTLLPPVVVDILAMILGA
jgi:hypothetical protein